MGHFRHINARKSKPGSASHHGTASSVRGDRSNGSKGKRRPGANRTNQAKASTNVQPRTHMSADSMPPEVHSPNSLDQPSSTTTRVTLDELESGEEEGTAHGEKQQQVEEETAAEAEAEEETEEEETEEEPEVETEEGTEEETEAVRDYFDLTYAPYTRKYVMVSKTEEYPRWQDLASVSMCTLKKQQIRTGAYVDIRMQASGEEAAYAKVKDIRVLAPKRWLLLLAWLYFKNDYYYESNHLQILLWDTVDAVLRPDKIALRSHVIYDVCSSGKLLSKPADLQKWQAREQPLHVATS